MIYWVNNHYLSEEGRIKFLAQVIYNRDYMQYQLQMSSLNEDDYQWHSTNYTFVDFTDEIRKEIESAFT